MQKSNSKDDILNRKIKQLSGKIGKWPGEGSLKGDILPDVEAICSEMGKSFLGLGGNNDAKKVKNQLKNFKNWEVKGELYPNTMKVACNIKKIKELEEIGKLLASKIEPMEVVDVSLGVLEEKVPMGQRSTMSPKTTHRGTLALLHHLGGVGEEVSRILNSKCGHDVTVTLKNGRLGLDEDLCALLQKIYGQATSINDGRFRTVVTTFAQKYKNSLNKIEQIIDEMVNIYNEMLKKLNVKAWKPKTVKEKNTLYDQIEGVGKNNLTAKKIVTTLITASDGKYDTNNETHTRLVNELGNTNGPLTKPMENLKNLLP